LSVGRCRLAVTGAQRAAAENCRPQSLLFRPAVLEEQNHSLAA
jgi:hypothetical protein